MQEKGELASWLSEAIAPENWSSHTTFSIQQHIDTAYDGLDRKVKESLWSGGVLYQVTQYSYDISDPMYRAEAARANAGPMITRREFSLLLSGSLAAPAALAAAPVPALRRAEARRLQKYAETTHPRGWQAAAEPAWRSGW